MNANTLRRLNWLWKHRHTHDDDDDCCAQLSSLQLQVDTVADVVQHTKSGQTSLRDFTEFDNQPDVTTTFTQNVPTVGSGDLLLWMVCSGAATHSTPSGWTLLDSETEPDVRSSIFYKVADGTEGSSESFTLGSAVRCYGVMISISPGGVDFASNPPQGSVVPGNTFDPPSVSPSGVPNDYLVFASLHWQSAEMVLVPTGYTAVNPVPSHKPGNPFVVVSEQRVAVTTSEDPAAFTMTNTAGYSGTGSTVAVLVGEAKPALAPGDHTHTEGEVTDHTTLSQKATPVVADKLLLYDSEDSHSKKWVEVDDLPVGTSDHGALTGLADDDHTQYLLAAGTRAATFLEVSGLTGATGSSPRFVGGTTSGAPVSGTFALGDYVVTEDGNIYVCTTAGSPGTWTAVGAGAATDSDAIHDNVANEITAITEKTSVADDDVFIIEDSAASFVKKKVKGSNLPSGGGGGGAFENALLHVRDEKTQNTSGGTFTSGAWRTRVLNTVKTNEITGASLATNQITLPAGTYWAEWEAPAYRVARHQSKLVNTTDTADVLIGSSAYAATIDSPVAHSMGRGRFVLAAEKVLELQHRCATSQTTLGFGVEANFATEVYADLRIWKVA